MKTAISFDDVLLVPQYGEIRSRKDINTATKISNNLKLKIPLISSCMNTITEENMAIAMWRAGGLGILHRYNTIEHQIDIFSAVKNKDADCAVAIGASSDYLERAAKLIDCGANILCVDVANGHGLVCIEAVNKIRSKYKDITLIAGNVATGKGAARLIDAGADSVRVGIGGGCFAGDTKILMANGTYKNIKDIKIHDQVINMNGRVVDVIAVRYSGIKKVLSYKSNFWYDNTYVTPDHQHWIGDLSHIKDINKVSKTEKLDKYNNTLYKWKAIGGDTSKSYLLMPKYIEFNLQKTFNVDLNDYAFSRRTMERFKLLPTLQPSYELGYIFGSFLGDGTASIYTSARNSGRRNTSGIMYWTYGIDEKEIAEKTKSYMEKVFGYECVIRANNKNNMLVVHVRSNPIIRLFEQFGKRRNKRLTDDFLCTDKDYCRGIVDGLIDSDGHIDGKRDGITNTSKYIIELYMFAHYIVRGYFPSTIKNENNDSELIKNAGISYGARSVSRPEFNWTEDYQVSTINRKEETAIEVSTYDIEVDCPTHSFIANNVIVHNSLCSTRIQTGAGVSTLYSIFNCKEYLYKLGYNNYSLLADGGIKYAGDITKSLAAGADAVILGQLLAATDESPGDVVECKDGIKYKKYAGMASFVAQADWRPDKKDEIVAEGEDTLLPCKGAVSKVLYQLVGGLRSGMSYCGTFDIEQLQKQAEFIQITSAGWIESKPHAKNNK